MTIAPRTLAKLFFVLASALLVVLSSARAFADDAPKVVILVDGGGGEKLATAIAGALPEPWTRADPKAFGKAAKTRKFGGVKALDAPKTRAANTERVVLAAGDVHAAAVLVVHVPPAKKNRTAHVLLFATPNKKPAVDTSVKLGAPSPTGDAEAVRGSVAAELAALAPVKGGAGETTPPPAGGAPQPGAGTPPTATTEPAKTPNPNDNLALGANASAQAGAKPSEPSGASPGDDAPALVDASLGLDLASRHFSYKDAVTTNLRPYDIDFAPQPTVKLELYPLAKGNMGVLRDIGVLGGFHASLGLDSQAPDGSRIVTTWTRVDIAARYRIRFAPGPRPPQVGIRAGYGRETFAFRDQGLRIQGELPSVAYQVIELGVDGRLPLGPIALLAGFQYQPVLHSGDVGKRIRGQSVAGIEAELGLGVPVGRHFEIRASADYRRFFYSFKPIPGDVYVAGGALEQIWRGELAAAVVY